VTDEVDMHDELASGLGRRVITGVDADGRSVVVSDEPTRARLERPDGSVVMDLWRVKHLPTHADDDSSLLEEVSPPPHSGLVVKLSTIPAHAEIDPVAYAQAIAEAYGPQPTSAAPKVAGMHRTETVDVVTVLSGELYAVLETVETVLRAGDTIVQRGTMHAWQNRSEQPATLVSVMMGAPR
jgi:mannose-6-phosphate isomerase-like protein (cupin superfamily)